MEGKNSPTQLDHHSTFQTKISLVPYPILRLIHLKFIYCNFAVMLLKKYILHILLEKTVTNPATTRTAAEEQLMVNTNNFNSGSVKRTNP